MKKYLFKKKSTSINKKYKEPQVFKGFYYTVVEEKADEKPYIKIDGVELCGEKVIVPEKIEGLPVKRISMKAFSGESKLKEVILPGSVKRLGKKTFAGCSNLSRVVLPEKMAMLPEACFSGCESLRSIVLPATLKRIEKDCFRDCNMLESIFHYGDGEMEAGGFPDTLTTIQEGAFAKCKNFKNLCVPMQVDTIAADTFRGCSSLELVTLGEGVKQIEENAFAGCSLLRRVKMPNALTSIEPSSFAQHTELMCDPQLQQLLQEKGYKRILVSDETVLGVVSRMVPQGEGEQARFYTDEDLKTAVDLYEMNPAGSLASDVCCKVASGAKSRYELRGDEYVLMDANGEKKQAKLILSGALLCEKMGSDALDLLKQITKDADLVIGQTAEIISGNKESYDTNVFFRMRAAGVDLAVNAFPHNDSFHVDDVYRTLHVANQAQLMHTGLFASYKDNRYVQMDINGIKVALVSYSDVADFVTQTKNYNNDGRKTLFHTYDKEEIRKTISNARENGADFVLAYSYWNKNKDSEITARQEECAKILADAGADYIFGCNDGGVMPYSVICTADQRKVPVVYSAGSLSKPAKKSKQKRDNLIAEVYLCRDEDGRVYLKDHGYYPFTETALTKEGSKISDIGSIEKEISMEERIVLEEAYIRIKKTIGLNEDFNCLTKVEPYLTDIAEGNVSPVQRKYETNPVRVGKKKHCLNTNDTATFVRDEETGIYYRGLDQGEREARIICTGQLGYDIVLERDAECFGHYEFRKSFKEVAKCFEDADFVYGNLSTMMSSEYPSICEMSKDHREEGYSNCREEFVAALKDAGFTGLAMANPHNAIMGISGIIDTEAALKRNNLISSGIGYEKNPIVDINGIKVGFLSITSECINKRNVLTDEAVAKFLNLYDEQRVKCEIEGLKERGAEFILAYIHCGTGDGKLNLKDRRQVAEQVAEAGADYVICSIPRVISEYYRYQTSDMRSVPVATSLGSFIAGKGAADGFDAVILQLFVRRTFDGTIEVEDRYIPLKVFKYYEGVAHPVIPALSYLNKDYGDDEETEEHCEENSFRNTELSVARKLGDGIKCSAKRLVKVAADYTKTLTIEEIYQILNKKPGKRDLERFGDKYKQPVSCVALRKRYMEEGGVAVMYKYGNFGEVAPIKWSIQECIDAGVSLVIDNEPHDEIPCIVVEEPLMDVFGLLSKTVRDWYHPVTVGITGSMGKTTTKELMTSVFETHYKTLCAQGNSNAIYQIGQIVQQMEDDDEAYIQEVHGGTKGTASFTSNVISPDICVITNIVQNHMSQIGSIENLIANKLGIADGLKENGVLILCHDNEYLKDANPSVRTIRYSVSDESCQYYAKNIRDEGDQIYFQIVSKESEFDEAGVYDAKLNIRGVHNVSNALASFAAGRQAGIPPHRIIAGLSRYRSSGIRQNVFDHGGVQMLLDTYNSNPKALMAMMDVFEKLERGENGRKILILGMMGEQGKDSPQIHYDTGKALCQYDFDKLFCIGKHAKYMVQAVKECGKEAYFFTDRETFNHVICANVREGDVVMVKGSHSMELDTETMVPIFGSAIRQN